MTTKRKAPVTSTSERSRIVAGASRIIQPPAHVALDARDIPFFNNIIEEFAKSEWTDHQIELAAITARLMADMVEEHAELRAEGSVITNAKGTKVVNPRRNILQMNAQAILNMRRSLSLNANSHGLKADRAKTQKKAKEIEDAVENDNDLLSEDSLLQPRMKMA